MTYKLRCLQQYKICCYREYVSMLCLSKQKKEICKNVERIKEGGLKVCKIFNILH